MDIHPPHQPVHTWKDVLIHLGIITLGLFVALMLEGFVEWVHHRHLVAEARANIRQEISDNTKLADKDLTSLRQNEQRLKQNLDHLAEIRATQKWGHRSLQYTLDWDSFSDSAWRSARDAGALGFMAYKQVQDLADVYGEQDIVNARGQKLFEDQPRALAPLFIAHEVDKTRDSDLERIQSRTADVLISVQVLEQIVTQLKQQYQDTLAKF